MFTPKRPRVGDAIHDDSCDAHSVSVPSLTAATVNKLSESITEHCDLLLAWLSNENLSSEKKSCVQQLLAFTILLSPPLQRTHVN